MNEVLKFLFQHANAKHTGQEWERLLKVNILDLDGWASMMDFKHGVLTLGEFIERLGQCTINFKL